MSRSAGITLGFAGEDREFRLSIGPLRALQEKTDAGPMELLQRCGAGNWRVDDLRETVLRGLIGGGMDNTSATRLVQANFDDQPLQQFVVLAQGILMACVVGATDEDLGESKGETAPASPSPTANSDSPHSTEAAPSSDTRPAK